MDSEHNIQNDWTVVDNMKIVLYIHHYHLNHHNRSIVLHQKGILNGRYIRT